VLEECLELLWLQRRASKAVTAHAFVGDAWRTACDRLARADEGWQPDAPGTERCRVCVFRVASLDGL
jgi:hypothetical protein